MMKSMPSKQRGFTLLEALVALVIFAMVILGRGMVMKYLLKTQKDIHVSPIVLDQMQERMQGVLGNPSSASGNICDSINKNSFVLDGQTFYLGCHVETDSSSGVDIKWPILAASSTSQAEADGCADGSALKVGCYVIGK